MATTLPQKIGQTTIVQLNDDLTHASPQLDPGRYTVYCDEVAVYVRQGGATVTADANELILRQGAYINDLLIEGTATNDQYLAFMRVTSTNAKVRITRTDSL